MKHYEIIIGNIGTVDTTNNPIDARRIYGECVAMSNAPYGRAAGEDVTLFEDGEPILEHFGIVDLEA